jgi:hypothetical protein
VTAKLESRACQFKLSQSTVATFICRAEATAALQTRNPATILSFRSTGRSKTSTPEGAYSMACTASARARRLEVFSMNVLSSAEGSHRRGLAKVLSWIDTQSDIGMAEERALAIYAAMGDT